MSIVRCNSKRCGSKGWQARAHVTKGHPRLTRFFADDTYGPRRAKWLAAEAYEQLQRQAARLKKRLGV